MELKLRKSFNESGVQTHWDATSLTAAETCERYYQYSILEAWRPNNENEHLRFGRHFGAALERYYKLTAEGADWEEALEQVVFQALCDTWDYKILPAQPLPDDFADLPQDFRHKLLDDQMERPLVGAPWQSMDSNKTRETLIRSIVWYVDQFHAEEVKVKILANGKPAVEHSFSLPVDNGITLVGHIDRVVEFADNPYVMDQKTTKTTITPRWFDQFKPNMQMSMYTFAGRVIFHLPVKGVIIDGAQIAVGFTRFERGITMRTEEELNEWYDDTMKLIEQTQRATLNRDFRMNSASCDKYGGCRFRSVCQRTPGLRENFLKADFHNDDPWDPAVPR